MDVFRTLLDYCLYLRFIRKLIIRSEKRSFQTLFISFMVDEILLAKSINNHMKRFYFQLKTPFIIKRTKRYRSVRFH